MLRAAQLVPPAASLVGRPWGSDVSRQHRSGAATAGCALSNGNDVHEAAHDLTVAAALSTASARERRRLAPGCPVKDPMPVKIPVAVNENRCYEHMHSTCTCKCTYACTACRSCRMHSCTHNADACGRMCTHTCNEVRALPRTLPIPHFDPSQRVVLSSPFRQIVPSQSVGDCTLHACHVRR